jgi:hypothetical protein
VTYNRAVPWFPVYATSEDPDFPFENLAEGDGEYTAKVWRSHRNCAYPVRLGIKLTRRTRLESVFLMGAD